VDPGDPDRAQQLGAAPLLAESIRAVVEEAQQRRRREVVAGPWPSSRPGPSSSTRLPQPPPTAEYLADQAELDSLLDKISDRGMDGLTGDEKRRLNELSKRMRNRK